MQNFPDSLLTRWHTPSGAPLTPPRILYNFDNFEMDQSYLCLLLFNTTILAVEEIDFISLFYCDQCIPTKWYIFYAFVYTFTLYCWWHGHPLSNWWTSVSDYSIFLRIWLFYILLWNYACHHCLILSSRDELDDLVITVDAEWWSDQRFGLSEGPGDPSSMMTLCSVSLGVIDGSSTGTDFFCSWAKLDVWS